MRILFAGQTYVPSTNGPAVFTANLAEALTRRGHHAAAIVPSRDGRRRDERRNGVGIHALPAVASARLDVAVTAFPGREVGRLLQRFVPDVVHIQDHYPTSRAVLAASRRLDVPVVGTNHFVPENIALQLPFASTVRRPVEGVLWWTVASVYRRLDAVTAPSRTAASLLQPRLPGTTVRPISCGVDVERFRPRGRAERMALRRRFGLSATASVALYVGRVDADKNVELLVVAGKGLQLEGLRRLAARTGLAPRVRFLGYVEDEALPDLYAACDLFVMPSAVELLSIATLEAMASGLPVAAARAGALPELVEEGVTGALFEPSDAPAAAGAMRCLAGGHDTRSGLGAAARQRAEEHRIERTRERFEALYHEVCASRAEAR